MVKKDTFEYNQYNQRLAQKQVKILDDTFICCTAEKEKIRHAADKRGFIKK